MTRKLLPALLAVALAAAADQGPARPPHERTARAGAHPRLFASPDDVEALRRKVNAPGTLSRELWSRGGSGWANPMSALLAETEEARKSSARSAIDEGLKLIRQWEVPWSDEPEWAEWRNYRLLALAYDCCYDRMAPEERREYQEEMLRIASHIAGSYVEATANNHWTVGGAVLGLVAIALEGDVPSEPIRFADVPVVRRVEKKGSGDFLPHRSGFRIEATGSAPGGSDYKEGSDYTIEWFKDKDTPPVHAGQVIVWRNGKGPRTGATYYVTYTFTPDFPRWKDLARLSLMRNLHISWGEGASLAGVLYGPFTISWSADLFEALRRNEGIDFSTHADVRDVVRWLPTELISGKRNNDRNDATLQVRGNLDLAADFCAWATARYKGDPEGKDDLAYWLLTGPLRSGTSWRSGLWLDGKYDGESYKRAKPIPLSRFFRGHDLANFRAGDLEGPDDRWTLFAMDSGINASGEHDNADKGAFTLYAMGEDFAIDSGNAKWDPRSFPPAAHNLVLVDGKDPFGGGARAASAFLTPHWDFIHSDMRNPRSDPKGWPQRANRYGVLLKSASGATCALVADDLATDGRVHAWEWLLHTHEQNRISLEKGRALLEGKNADCAVRFFGPQAPSLRQDRWETRGKGTHPRLLAAVKAPNPMLLALMIPQRKGEEPPFSASELEAKGGKVLRIACAEGENLVLWRFGEAPLSFQSKGRSAQTDCALALLHYDREGVLKGWLAADGASLKVDGKTLWRIRAPSETRGDACFDGTLLHVSAPSATEFEALAPTADGFLNFAAGLAIPLKPAADGTMRWKGRRALADTWPAGTPVMAEGFQGGAEAFWSVIPLRGTGFTRAVDGEFCCPGLRAERLSYAHLNVNQTGHPVHGAGPPRADLFTWPRTHFTDAILKGKVTFHDWKPGAVLRILGGVRDRTYPGAVPGEGGADQAFLKELKISPSNKGKPQAFELRMEGGEGAKPGYFQWEIPEGMHVHLDNIRIEIPQ